MDFKIEGIEELERDLTKAIKKCPVQAREEIKGIAKEFKKSARKKAQTELKKHTRKESQINEAINKKWGMKILDEGIAVVALVYNSARHFHLIELGHNLVKNGSQIGFVNGKFIMERTKNEYEEIVPARFEKMVDDILKESDL